MQSHPIPPLMPVPFAANGQKNVIPEASQISITRGAASLNDGFPPLTMTSPLQGGIPPFGKDMNGVLFLFAQTIRWVQAGGSFCYDASFANDPNVGGYPQGAVLLNASLTGFWVSTVDNNATDPDATDGSAQGWQSMNPDWNAVNGPGAILNRPDLAKVATTGEYDDLLGLPNLAVVATTGDYNDLIDTPAIPPEYALPPATTTTLGGIIAGPGTSVAADGTLSVAGQVKTVNEAAPDAKGNVSVILQDAEGVVANQTVSLIQFQGGTGNPLLRILNCNGIGTHVFYTGQNLEIDTVPATTGSAGTVIAGSGLAVAADGTLSAAAPIVLITAANATIPDDCNGKIFKVVDAAVNALALPLIANVGQGKQFRMVNMAAPQLVLRATAPDMLDDVTFTNRAIGSVMIAQGAVATVSYGDANITVQSQPGVGVQPWDLVQLDANSRLPKVDGSQLTGIDGTLIAVTVYSVVAQTVSFATVPQSISCTMGLPLAGSPVVFTTTGALPPELVAGTTYYVVSPSPANSQFRVSATWNGAPIAVSSVGTGTHSIANPPWLKATNNAALVDFELQGGGAAGGLGGPSNGSGTATGGGAGGYARLRRPASALPDSLGITIGAGGLPPSATGYSNAGGTTSLGTLASATGGSGGYGYSNNQLILGSPGGTAVGGDLIIDGQGSAPVIVSSTQNATGGGSSMFGFGGMGWAYLGGSTPKTDATGRGAGGAGGNATSSGGFGVGRGTDGLIVIREYA